MSTVAVLEDKAAVTLAYRDVRNDNSETRWLLLDYKEEGKIKLHSTGTDYNSFYEKFTNTVRLFGYIRVEHHHGDTKTTKYLFISWVGKDVKKEYKDGVEGHKKCVKEVIKEYTLEMTCTEDIRLHKNKVEEICRAEIKEKEVVKVK